MLVQPTHVPARAASGLATDPAPVPPSAPHRATGSTPSQVSHVPPVPSATATCPAGLLPSPPSPRAAQPATALLRRVPPVALDTLNSGELAVAIHAGGVPAGWRSLTNAQ